MPKKVKNQVSESFIGRGIKKMNDDFKSSLTYAAIFVIFIVTLCLVAFLVSFQIGVVVTLTAFAGCFVLIIYGAFYS